MRLKTAILSSLLFSGLSSQVLAGVLTYDFTPKNLAYSYDPTYVSGVTFAGNTGVTTGEWPFDFFGTGQPSGSLFGMAFIQQGATSAITFDLSAVRGETTISFYDIARGDARYNAGELPVTVSYGGTVIGSFTDPSASQWTEQSFTFDANGSDLVLSTGAYSDRALAIAGVQIAPAGGTGISIGPTSTPELSTNLMLAMGALALAFAGYRRKSLGQA
jgi:hypothetical protein